VTGAARPYDRANAAQRFFRRSGATRAGSWLYARVLHHVDEPFWRWSRGRFTFTSLATGLPTLVLTTTGARSGLPRTVPLLGLPDREGIVVIASSFGRSVHPAWYFNLRAEPHAEVLTGGQVFPVIAEQVTGERRSRIWREALRVYPGFATYERRAAHRDIGVFLLRRA
jgi:deazaflavin-dependent oxidoreductase (nitroreductase family)